VSPSIETIDKLPKPPQNDRVHKSGRTKETADGESFKRALKRKMEGDDDSAEEHRDQALILEIDLSKQKRHGQEDEDDTESASKNQKADTNEPEPGDTEQSPGPDSSIDLKA